MSSRFATNRNRRHPTLDAKDGCFRPSRLFGQDDFDDEDSPRSVIPSTFLPPPPVESIVVRDDMSSCCSSLGAPQGVIAKKQISPTRANNKKNRYRDLSRAALPTERGRRKVMAEKKRRMQLQTRQDDSWLSMHDTQERAEGEDVETRDDSNLILREHQKAIEQRLVLDQVESLVFWLTAQEELAVLQKDDDKCSDLEDSCPADDETCHAVVFWCDSAEIMKNPVQEEEESVITSSSNDEQKEDESIITPTSNEERKENDQLLLTLETSRIITWLMQQERFEENCPTKRELYKAESHKEDQCLLHKETARLTSWITNQEQTTNAVHGLAKQLAHEKDKLFKEKQRKDQEDLVEETSRPGACPAKQEKTEENHLLATEDAKKPCEGDKLLLMKEPAQLDDWLAKQNQLSEKQCLSDSKSNSLVAKGNEKDELAIVYHGKMAVTTLPQTEGTEKAKPVIVTPAATVNTSRSCNTSSSSLFTPFNKNQESTNRNEFADETPTTVSTPLAAISPFASFSTTASEERVLAITPQGAVTEGIQPRSGNTLMRYTSKNTSHRKSKRTNLSFVKMMHAQGVVSSMIPREPTGYRRLDSLEDDDETVLSYVSGLTGTRFVDKSLFRSPCSSAYPVKEEGYLHAQKAGLLWQTIVGEQVRFPKSWWNGARSPQMGVETILSNGTIPQQHKWRYLSLDHCYSNPLLNSFVRNSTSSGRLLLHIMIRDESWKAVQDVAIGCYHPDSLHPKTDEKDSGCRSVWMAIRRRSDHVAETSTALIDPILTDEDHDSETPVLRSPLGRCRKVKNNHLRQVFGYKPPQETIIILESELVKRIRVEREAESQISLLLLEMFLGEYRSHT